jgi:hypothetical protein
MYRILGVVLIPDKKINRYNEKIGFFCISFSKDTILEYKKSFDKNIISVPLTKNHTTASYKNYFYSNSIIIDETNKDVLPDSFKDCPFGTWLLEITFYSKKEYDELINSDLKGISIDLEYTIQDDEGINHQIIDSFRMMNKLSDLISINIYVRGGSTGSSGRSEHGEAHFEVHKKNSGENVGKILMPKLNIWERANFKEKSSLLKVVNSKDISKRDKKVLIKWLENNDNENLKKCYEEWNRVNEYNKQAILI